MNRVEKMFHAIERKTNSIPDGYNMNIEELFALYEKFGGDPVELITATFKYGFAKGENCATNKARKAAQQCGI